MANLPEVMQGFFALLKSHKEEGLINYLTDDIILDDPLHGRFSGHNSFRSYAEDFRLWHQKYNAGIEPIHIVTAENGIAAEYRFLITVGGERRDLPVAMAADLVEGMVSRIRVYHSTWPLYGKHQGIQSLIAENPSLSLPGAVEKYMKSLELGSPVSIVALFEEDGYVREPSGDSYCHKGKENLMKFYSSALSLGGILLKHCNLTLEMNTVAVEYFFSEWGSVEFPREAGIAFFELSDSGRIKAVRIYDDANPPI